MKQLHLPYFQLLFFFLIGCTSPGEKAKDSAKADSVFTATQITVKDTDLLVPGVIDNPAWENKKQAGVAWLGIGTEPFWSIERKRDSIYFQLSEWPQSLSFHAKRILNSKDSIIYMGGDSLRAVIKAGKCSDGMSDRVYNYSIRIEYQQKVFEGCLVVF